MKVSIISLIYKSIPYLKFIKRRIEKNTSKDIVWEFHFVTNNATEEVIDYLLKNNIPHYIFETEPQPPYPANIGYIYKAWNFAVEKAEGDVICLVNSDMAFSKDWLKNLLKRLNKNKVVSSLLVESGKLLSLLPHTVVKNFGRTPETFQEEKFEEFAEILKEDTEQLLGGFMPMVVHKENFIRAGGYPEGNRILPNGRQISGDWIFFYERLARLGIKHVTSFDSITYHIQTGETDEKMKNIVLITTKHNPSVNKDTSKQIKSIKPKRVVDVGAGDGFYGKLVRILFPECFIIGIEIYEPYIIKYELKNYYNKLIVEDIRMAIKNNEVYGDLIIFGDILEHLPKQDVFKVMDETVKKFKFVLVNSPLDFQPQSEKDNNPYEKHLCGLSKKDFLKYNIIEYNEFREYGGIMFNLLIKGEANGN